MKRSSIGLFFAVVALCLLPVATAFACGPCIDECCAAAKTSNATVQSQTGPLVAVLPSQDEIRTGRRQDALRANANSMMARFEPLHSPLRI